MLNNIIKKHQGKIRIDELTDKGRGIEILSRYMQKKCSWKG